VAQGVAVLELRGIHKSYREGEITRPVLTGLDARFEAGRVSAVLGRSGSGKSTLLNLVSGIDLPDAGSVLLEGRDLTRLSDRQRTLHRRAYIGFVFQFYNLIPTLSVEENVLLPLDLLGSAPAPARRRVAELLAAVELGDRARSFPDALSGGEQQRVAVARALVHEPGLVLADEPTGNLDAVTAGEVLRLLCGMSREAGATLVLVTHSAEAAANADRCFGIEDGRLHEIPRPSS